MSNEYGSETPRTHGQESVELFTDIRILTLFLVKSMKRQLSVEWRFPRNAKSVTTRVPIGQFFRNFPDKSVREKMITYGSVYKAYTVRRKFMSV